jgi:hypothetical protein
MPKNEQVKSNMERIEEIPKTPVPLVILPQGEDILHYRIKLLAKA